MSVVVITAKGATSELELGLVALTEALVKSGKAPRAGGLLGGEFGYGCDFENDVFMMHPYCWCEQETCRWCSGGEWNFFHKATGFGVEWYKWIGRGMEFSNDITKDQWAKILQECLESIK